MTKLILDRVKEFDLIKCIAIYLVIWGHSIQHLYSQGDDSNLYKIIYMFHMPLFMMISGFFAKRSLDLKFTTVLKKKGIQLIYPCISFGLFFVILSVLFRLGESHLFSMSAFFNSLYGIFWFLKCLFVCYVIAYVCIKLTINNLWGGVIAIVLCQCIPLFKVNYMMPFFVIGLWSSEYLPSILKHKKSVAIVSTILFICFSFIFIDESRNWSAEIRNVKNGLMSADVYVLQTYLIVQFERFVLGLSGSMMVIFLTFSLSDCFNRFNGGTSKWMCSVGKYTLGIYIIQTLLLEIIMARLIDLSFIDRNIFLYILTPILSLVVMQICHIISKSIIRNRSLKKMLYLK